MKLVWHEFKTLTQQWKWLIPLWWLLVLIYLGYQSHWWWEGSQSWISSHTSHETVSMLVRTFIWTGLGLSTLIVFLGISPEQLKTASRLRPISAKGRLLSRMLFLTSFIGMPWWLHELYYLAATARLPADHIALGVFESMLSTAVFWFLCGCLGWASGTFTRAAQLAGIGWVILVALVKIDELTNWLTPHIFAAPQHSWTDWSRFGNWSHFVAAITLGSGLLFWLWGKNNKPSRSNFSNWLEFITIVTAPTTASSRHLQLNFTKTIQNAHDDESISRLKLRGEARKWQLVHEMPLKDDSFQSDSNISGRLKIDDTNGDKGMRTYFLTLYQPQLSFATEPTMSHHTYGLGGINNSIVVIFNETLGECLLPGFLDVRSGYAPNIFGLINEKTRKFEIPTNDAWKVLWPDGNATEKWLEGARLQIYTTRYIGRFEDEIRIAAN